MPSRALLTLPGAYLRQMAEQVQALGADVDAWLVGSGLTRSQLDDPPALALSAFEKLTEDALRLTNEPAFGLFVGQRLQMQTHGVLGYAAVSSGSIRQALGLLESFTRTRFSLVELALEETAREVKVRISMTHSLGAAERPVLEAIVMATKNIVDAISMGACRIETVAFPFPEPPYGDLARELFACDVRWRATWAGYTLPQKVLDVPLRAADAHAFREAVRICERELERLSANETVEGRVRRLLVERQHGFPSLEVAARLLHLGPRTLHRRLVEEGTSFREVLEDVRHHLAIEHLKIEKLSLQEIAYTLGYTDFSNFRRAFRRWEGMPPAAYRKRLLRGARGASPANK